MYTLSSLFWVLLITFVIILICRGITCWYFRITETIALLEGIQVNLRCLVRDLDKIREQVCPGKQEVPSPPTPSV